MTHTVVVLGASSLVGKRLFLALRSKLPQYGDYAVLGTHYSSPSSDTDHLDITSAVGLRDYVLDKRPDSIILVAGNKDVAACENDGALARRLNTMPAELLCDFIAGHLPNIRLLYLSSDYVFDGKEGGYRWDAPTCPATNYGRSKVEAERRLLRGDVEATVVRTAAVMTHEGGFLRWLVDGVLGTAPVSLLANSYFSPTPVELLADCIVTALLDSNRRLPRVLHAVGGLRMSRFQTGLLVRDMLRELGVAHAAPDLQPESLPAAKDLCLVPNVFPGGDGTRAPSSLQDYLRRELLACID